MTADPDADRQQLSMLDHALAYLERGLPIFPVCSPLMGTHKHWDPDRRQMVACPPDKRGKTPMVKWKPYQTELPSEIDVRSWWAKWPVANVGLATGALSGRVVLDCDSGEAKKLAMERGGLDRAPAIFTGKPGGVHFHIEHPGAAVHNFARRLPGLDFRGDGGYCILPPSRHASGASYRWVGDSERLAPPSAPPWLLELLSGTGEGEAAGDPLNLDEILFGVPEGQRDAAMWRLACKLRADDVERRYAELIVGMAALACRPPFDVAVAVEKVARAYRQYEPDPTFTVGETSTPNEPSDERGYQLQQFAEILDVKENNAAYLVDGVIWANRTTWVFSEPNTGKTLVMLALLLHIAAGRPFHGRSVRQGPALLIEEDSPLSVIAEYGEMLADVYGFDLPSLPLWINRLQGLRVATVADVQTVIDAVKSCPQKPVVVLFDACERLVPSDRFTTKELDPLTRLFQWLVSEQITPIMIDHTNKDRPRKGEKPVEPVERLYGGRTKSAVSDVMVYFEGRLNGDGVQVSFVKFRGEKPPGFSVRFNGVDELDIRSERMSAQSPAEAVVMRFFNNNPRKRYHLAEIEAATDVKRRTLQRALQVLAKRGWLIAYGEGFDREYERNASAPGPLG